MLGPETDRPNVWQVHQRSQRFLKTADKVLHPDNDKEEEKSYPDISQTWSTSGIARKEPPQLPTGLGLAFSPSMNRQSISTTQPTSTIHSLSLRESHHFTNTLIVDPRPLDQEIHAASSPSHPNNIISGENHAYGSALHNTKSAKIRQDPGRWFEASGTDRLQVEIHPEKSSGENSSPGPSSSHSNPGVQGETRNSVQRPIHKPTTRS